MKKLLIILLIIPSLCYPWGEEGHRIMGKITEKHLTSVTKAKLNKLLDGKAISEVSNWLDKMRPVWDRASVFHYISMPVDALRYEPVHCDNGGICAISMINKYENRLLTSIESPHAKGECIKVMVHLFQDLHMPLHTGGQKNDYGGNGVKIDFFGKSSNLHKLYDTNIIQYAKKTDDEWVDYLLKDLTPDDIIDIQSGSLEDWVNDSHAIVKAIYDNLPKKKIDKKVIIDENYVEFGNKIIEQQILKSGLRLAKYLNERMDKVTMN